MHRGLQDGFGLTLLNNFPLIHDHYFITKMMHQP